MTINKNLAAWLLFGSIGNMVIFGSAIHWFFGNAIAMVAAGLFLYVYLSMTFWFTFMDWRNTKADYVCGTVTIFMLIIFVFMTPAGLSLNVFAFNKKLACAETVLGQPSVISEQLAGTTLNAEWAAKNSHTIQKVVDGVCDNDQATWFMVASETVGFDDRFVRENGIISLDDKEGLRRAIADWSDNGKTKQALDYAQTVDTARKP